MATIESPLMTDEEAAEYLRIPSATLKYYRSAKKGPPYRKIGRNVKYTKKDLDQWIEARYVVPQNN